MKLRDLMEMLDYCDHDIVIGDDSTMTVVEVNYPGVMDMLSESVLNGTVVSISIHEDKLNVKVDRNYIKWSSIHGDKSSVKVDRNDIL